jgi:SAM-dependent methyltransferase
VEAIIAASPGPDVLDVGCGTGIAARQFQAAGCTVLGVEPDTRMAEFARRTGIEVEEAMFEAWDSTGRRFDAVIAGTAWHWVDPGRRGGQGRARAAARRPARAVLPCVPGPSRGDRRSRPGLPAGGLPGRSSAAEASPGRLPAAVRQDRRRDPGGGGFSEPEQWRFGWERTYTRDGWLDQLPTHGHLNLFPPDKLATVLQQVGAAVDAIGGSFTMAYNTVAVTAARTTSA